MLGEGGERGEVGQCDGFYSDGGGAGRWALFECELDSEVDSSA